MVAVKPKNQADTEEPENICIPPQALEYSYYFTCMAAC